MMWKLLFVVALAVGVLADEYKITDENRQQLRDMLRAQCTKNGAEGAAADVEKAGQNFVDCIKSLVDIEQMKKEIEEAKPNGALDEVFKKYCAKTPELKTCIHTLSNAIVPCLESSVKEHVGMANNATDQLIDFVCYKDGDRIALFIAEAGPECFAAKANAIRECGNKLKETVSTVEAAKSLGLNEQCSKFDSLSACVTKALEECDTPTPANMADSLFRFIRKGSPCKDIPKN